MEYTTTEDLRRLAEDRLRAIAPGEPMDSLERSLVVLGVSVSVTSLDRTAIERSIGSAFDQGASADQIQEVVSLVSGLGVHSLMASSAAIADAARAHGRALPTDLVPHQRELWERHVGNDQYWAKFNNSVPGFLDALIRLSPDQFEAFFTYCAVPWKARAVRARTKELVALACDATPVHRFLPGFLLHLDNALAVGVGRLAILETLELAEHAPPHRGFA